MNIQIKIKQLLKENEYLVFVFSRGILLISKPIALFLLIQNNYEKESTFLSLFFLTQASVMIIFNNEAHFVFYNVLFKEKQNVRKLALMRQQYFQDIFKQIITFSPVVFFANYLLLSSLKLSFIMLIVLIFDKIFDEIQRLLQFQKNFILWSIVSLIKVLPSLIIASILLRYLPTLSFSLTHSLTYLLFIVIAILLGLNKNINWNIINAKKIFQKFNLKNYINHYLKNLIINQFQSILSRNIPQSDRLLIRFIDINMLAEISIYSQIGTGAVLFVDYFIISHRRKEYIEESKSVNSIISSKKMFAYFLVIATLYSLMLLVLSTLDLKSNQAELTIQSQILIFSSFIVYAFTQHYVNYNFWQRKRRNTIAVELIYYLLLLLFAFGLSNYSQSDFIIDSVLLAILFANLIRFGTSAILALKNF